MTNEQHKAMSGRIKERREQLGFTQEQFAEQVEISNSSYTKIENTFQKPSLDTLIRISQKLGLSIDYIVLGALVQPPPTNAEIATAIIEFTDTEKITHARDVLNKLIKLKGDA